MPIIHMKRPHSPCDIGISNYKRQRLIEDLQNLSISDTPNIRRVENVDISKNSAVNSKILPQAVKDQVWDLVKNGGRSKDPKNRIYDKIWETIRDSNLQVIKWYNGAELVYKQWLLWFQKYSLGFLNEKENDMDVDEGDVMGGDGAYGYEPMVIDTDY